MNAASFHQKASSNIKMYEFADRNDISSVILSCEWERARDFDYINGYYSINGFNLSEDGYLSGNYKGYYVVYKLKDDIYLDKLRTMYILSRERPAAARPLFHGSLAEGSVSTYMISMKPLLLIRISATVNISLI